MSDHHEYGARKLLVWAWRETKKGGPRFQMGVTEEGANAAMDEVEGPSVSLVYHLLRDPKFFYTGKMKARFYLKNSIGGSFNKGYGVPSDGEGEQVGGGFLRWRVEALLYPHEEKTLKELAAEASSTVKKVKDMIDTVNAGRQAGDSIFKAVQGGKWKLTGRGRHDQNTRGKRNDARVAIQEQQHVRLAMYRAIDQQLAEKARLQGGAVEIIPKDKIISLRTHNIYGNPVKPEINTPVLDKIAAFLKTVKAEVKKLKKKAKAEKGKAPKEGKKRKASDEEEEEEGGGGAGRKKRAKTLLGVTYMTYAGRGDYPWYAQITKGSGFAKHSEYFDRPFFAAISADGGFRKKHGVDVRTNTDLSWPIPIFKDPLADWDPKKRFKQLPGRGNLTAAEISYIQQHGIYSYGQLYYWKVHNKLTPYKPMTRDHPSFRFLAKQMGEDGEWEAAA